MVTVSGEVGDDQLRQMLMQARHIAVVGLSPRHERPSYQVAEYLQRQGYVIYPVNPTQVGNEILGRPVFASLRDLPTAPDIIDVFRRSIYLPDVVADADALRQRSQPDARTNRYGALWVIWTQLGVVNDEAARRAHELGFAVVEDRCLKIEHGRLGIGRIGDGSRQADEQWQGET
jgi:predicted CoA-binding protein